VKLLDGNDFVPRGLLDMHIYFRYHDAINFKYLHKKNTIVALSTNFGQGKIITSGKNERELDRNIKDAILTAFEVPSSYAREAKLHRVGEKQKEYALS